jgi:hypothetical protein
MRLTVHDNTKLAWQTLISAGMTAIVILVRFASWVGACRTAADMGIVVAIIQRTANMLANKGQSVTGAILQESVISELDCTVNPIQDMANMLANKIPFAIGATKVNHATSAN